ncbi:MAG: tetratricopeptide repeat protein [Candidatus Accumulibacter sp.]|jgi:Tfp pilus assembly protein PilF|nr:tetratricopeptide repeat protein [Accumulibacter sp.]
MSLLMDALRKAEEARRQAESKAVPATELALAPLDPPAAAAKTGFAPEPSRYAGAAYADDDAVHPARIPGAPPRRSTAESGTRERAAAAHDALAAKHPPKNSRLWPIAGLGLLAILGLGIHYGWPLRILDPLATGRPLATPAVPPPLSASTPAVPPPPSSAPTGERPGAPARTSADARSTERGSEIAPSALPGERPGTRTRASAESRSTERGAETTLPALPSERPEIPTRTSAKSRLAERGPETTRPAPSSERPETSARTPAESRFAERGTETTGVSRPSGARAGNAAPPRRKRIDTATGAANDTAVDADDATPRLTRTSPRPDAALEGAYQALRSGRNEEARNAYERVLRADARNIDALLGLATLAARQGQADAAHAWYLRALEADPNDATARAGAFSTARQIDAEAAESHLKIALSAQPGSPPLLFALGNLYARQQRWSEAQQAYFEAHTGEPDDPDILFNLAVSLDHLRQAKLAAQYYRKALTARATRAATFNQEQAQTRLLELQP